MKNFVIILVISSIVSLSLPRSRVEAAGILVLAGITLMNLALVIAPQPNWYDGGYDDDQRTPSSPPGEEA